VISKMRLRCAISGQTHEFDFAADAPVRIARTRTANAKTARVARSLIEKRCHRLPRSRF
jgi:hypothetical protein